MSPLEARRGKLLVNERIQSGATLVEYALLLSMISVVSISGLTAIGHESRDRFTELVAVLESGGSSSSAADAREGPVGAAPSGVGDPFANGAGVFLPGGNSPRGAERAFAEGDDLPPLLPERLPEEGDEGPVWLPDPEAAAAAIAGLSGGSLSFGDAAITAEPGNSPGSDTGSGSIASPFVNRLFELSGDAQVTAYDSQADGVSVDAAVRETQQEYAEENGAPAR